LNAQEDVTDLSQQSCWTHPIDNYIQCESFFAPDHLTSLYAHREWRLLPATTGPQLSRCCYHTIANTTTTIHTNIHESLNMMATSWMTGRWCIYS